MTPRMTPLTKVRTPRQPLDENDDPLTTPRQPLDDPSTTPRRRHTSPQPRRTLDVPSMYPRRTLDAPSMYPRRPLDDPSTPSMPGLNTGAVRGGYGSLIWPILGKDTVLGKLAKIASFTQENRRKSHTSFQDGVGPEGGGTSPGERDLAEL